MSLILSILLATVVSWLIIPFMWKHALRLGFVDEPDPRKVHHVPIARVGGWGIVLGAVFSIFILIPMEPVYQAYIMGSLVLLLFGAWDDRREAGHYAKFIGQFIAVIPIVTYGDLYIKTLPFFEIGAVPTEIGIPFTVFAMVGMINAINHSDGLDGLAGGESLISLIAIAFLAYIYEGFTLLIIACATIGGILGFLRYNSHPAHVFMGDSGSQFLGFTLAFLVISLTQEVNPVLSPALPLLLLGLPVIDILAVLFLRVKNGMNWFLATKNHIHHRLLNLGFDHYESVVLIYSIHALFVISAVFMRFEWEYLILLEYFAIIFAIFFTLTYLEKKNWRFQPQSYQSRLAHYVESSERFSILKELPNYALAIAIPIYILLTGFTTNDVSIDLALLGVVLCIIYLWSIYKAKAKLFVFRLVVYTVAILMVYLNYNYTTDPFLSQLETIFFAILALTVVITIRYSKKGTFHTTPTDYLILFLILLVTAISGVGLEQAKIAAFVVKAVIILYAMELIILRQDNWQKLLGLAASVNLVVIFMKGVF